MLMKIDYKVINSLDITLQFDDGSNKREKVSIGDIVNIIFNKNGLRKNIEGVVKDIVQGYDSTKNATWYLLVDASTCGMASLERIEVGRILDIDVLQRCDGLLVVHTPSNGLKVTDLRLAGDQLQISTNYGRTWFKVAEINPSTYPVPAEYQELAAKIDALLPKHMNPAVRMDLIVALVMLFKSISPEDMDIKRIEEKLDATIEEVIENASNIDFISRLYALADQGDEQ